MRWLPSHLKERLVTNINMPSRGWSSALQNREIRGVKSDRMPCCAVVMGPWRSGELAEAANDVLLHDRPFLVVVDIADIEPYLAALRTRIDMQHPGHHLRAVSGHGNGDHIIEPIAHALSTFALAAA